jgi:hypothetical protein
MTAKIYMVMNAETRETRLFCKKLPLRFTTYIRFGNTVFFTSFIRFLPMTINLSTLIPPDVDPAQAPHSMSMIVRNNEKGPQPSASFMENPVDVIAEMT